MTGRFWDHLAKYMACPKSNKSDFSKYLENCIIQSSFQMSWKGLITVKS